MGFNVIEVCQKGPHGLLSRICLILMIGSVVFDPVQESLLLNVGHHGSCGYAKLENGNGLPRTSRVPIFLRRCPKGTFECNWLTKSGLLSRKNRHAIGAMW